MNIETEQQGHLEIELDRRLNKLLMSKQEEKDLVFDFVIDQIQASYRRGVRDAKKGESEAVE